MKTIFLSIFLLFTLSGLAHSDFFIIKNYNNVRVSFLTGYNYEEINKALIIAKLAEKLAIEMNYEEQLFLNFNHDYTHDWNIITDYFISYDLIGKDSNDQTKDASRINSLIVRQAGKSFDVENTLKLVEYAILNKQTIEKKQKQIVYHRRYNHWEINSIDSITISNVLAFETSERIKKVMKNRIERPMNLNSKHHSDFSYYWQDGKFYLYTKDVGKEVVFKTLDKIYFVHNFDLETVIFDTDVSFFFVNSHTPSQPFVSKVKVIDNEHIGFRPLNVNIIGYNKISLNFYYYEHFDMIEKVLIYYADEDTLIQDLDALITMNKN